MDFKKGTGVNSHEESLNTRHQEVPGVGSEVVQPRGPRGRETQDNP